MHPIDPTAPKVTAGIPLYRSARFLDTITRNVDQLLDHDVEILISDRHCLDDAVAELRKRYGTQGKVRFFVCRDRRDWVHNINFLLGEARGEYWRFMPHDDLWSPGSHEALVRVLDDAPDAVLSYAPTEYLDISGNPLERPHPYSNHPDEGSGDWRLGTVLRMYWDILYYQCFKGLIRRRKLVERRLFLRNATGQILPDRYWMFGLALLGRFVLAHDATYYKRMYGDSTHAQWRKRPGDMISAARTMSWYAGRLLGKGLAGEYARRDLWLNAFNRFQWAYDNRRSRLYLEAPSPWKDAIRGLSLPFSGNRGPL